MAASIISVIFLLNSMFGQRITHTVCLHGPPIVLGFTTTTTTSNGGSITGWSPVATTT